MTKWIVGNNGVDVHTADENFDPVCTAFDKKTARLIAAAPDLLAALDLAYLDIINFLNDGDFKKKVEWDAGYIVDALAKARR